MLAEDKSSEHVSKLIIALEAMIAVSSRRIEKKHEFQFVSSAQSGPYSLAFAQWERRGRVGPPPYATPAQIRAAIYAQAESASQLKAFVKVASVMMVELAEVAVAGLREGRIVVAYTALRGLIERIAHATAFADALTIIRSAPRDGPLTPVLELSEVINKALYGTQREWSAVVKADFRQATAKDLKYVRKDNTADAGAVNILKSIDKLDRRVAGARLVYEILCEFLHPNVGDLWAATVAANNFYDRYGTRHLVRTLGLGPKSLKGLPDQQVVYLKLLEICTDVVAHASLAVEEVEATSRMATVLTRKFAHLAAKNYREYFANTDLCPCLSGLTVKACRRAL
ncbi:MAG TPA: hypothetical protein VIF34_06880 [Methylocystis sp.]|jgi:hypothetical protein